MAGLTALLGRAREKSVDDDKLLNLYWNRAELKKAFADLRKEKYRLQDKLREADGATARLQQKLDRLEELLLDPEWCDNVLVFYQLRSLALRCRRKLARFAEQLKQQRERRRHEEVVQQWQEAPCARSSNSSPNAGRCSRHSSRKPKRNASGSRGSAVS